eukprot:7029792-Ditylum_brightwellii.AAC.1
MEVHVISHAEPNTCAQSAAEKKEDFCEKQVSDGDGKERKRESGAKGEVMTHLWYQFFDFNIDTTKEILVSKGDMRRSRVPEGDTLHQNRPNSGSEGEGCPATEHSRSKVGHMSKEISMKEFLDENKEQIQANTENTKQEKHQKKQNNAEKNLLSMKNVRKTIEAITMVVLVIQKVFEWFIPVINTRNAYANAQGRLLLKQEKKIPEFVIETQNNPNVTSEKDKQNSSNIGMKNAPRDRFNNLKRRGNTQSLSMEISHEYTKDLTWEAKRDELKRLDEVTYLGSYEGEDFERKNVMEMQDKPKNEPEVDQKKVIINSKNGTKTSKNYADNQPHKIKTKIEPTEPNKTKIEPKNQPEKEEV